MHALDDPRQRGLAIAGIANRQHGVITRRQLLAAGLGSGAIQHRLACGGLDRIHREVYTLGHRALTARGKWMAAVLACGEGAVLSHRSAAALWGFAQTAGTDIDVTVPRRAGNARPGIEIHRVARARSSRHRRARRHPRDQRLPHADRPR